MKKLLLTFSIVCLFISCETKYYSVLITNKSSQTVSYTYNDIVEILLPYAVSQDPPQEPSEYSRAYEVKAYTQLPAYINVLNYAFSVTMNQKGDTFTFEDVEPITFNVINTLPFDIIITAGNYIWDSKEKTVELTVPAKKELPNTERPELLFIYTEKPNFTTTLNYPAIFEWNIIDLDDPDELDELDELDNPGKPKKKLLLIIK